MVAFCSEILAERSTSTPVGMPRSTPTSMICLTRAAPPVTTRSWWSASRNSPASVQSGCKTRRP
jgi:hypothetical protein